MPIADLLTDSVTIRSTTTTGTDDFGLPTTTPSDVVVSAYVQYTRHTEDRNGREVTTQVLRVHVPAATVVTTGDTLVYDGTEWYISGVDTAWNARTARANHKVINAVKGNV